MEDAIINKLLIAMELTPIQSKKPPIPLSC